MGEIKSIFISATSVDLSSYVQKLEKFLKKSGYQVKTMVDFGAQPEDAVTVSLAELDRCDAMVGIYGRRYGYIPQGDGLSVTEQEYHHAREVGKPVFAFIVDETNSDLRPGDGEEDDTPLAKEKQAKLQAFLSQIHTALVRDLFTTPDDLKSRVLSALSRYNNRPKELQPPTEAIRLVLDDEREIRFFHNDKKIDACSPSLPPSLRHNLNDYKRDRKRLEPVKSGMPGPSAAEFTVDKMGTELGQALFSGKASDTAMERIQRAVSDGKRIQVAFQAGGTLWEGYPLETLWILGHNEPLALFPGVDLFRLAGRREFDAMKSISGPLKILMAVAAPQSGDNVGVLDYEAELGRVMDIVEKIPDFTKPDRRPIVHILDQGTLEAICGAFSRNRYHILHISSHGEPGHLILEEEDETARKVSAEEFIKYFPAGRQPILTMLSACHTGAAGEMNSFATDLINRGFPYVVAMQDTVTDSYATDFAQLFYHKLTYDENPVIEEAFSQVRLRLEMRRIEENRQRPQNNQILPEWMIPVLYKGNLCRHAAYEPDPLQYDRKMETPEESFEPDIAHRRIGEFVGRKKELLSLRREVLDQTGGGAALITGMGGVGKSTLVARSLANAVRSGREFKMVSLVGTISLVDLLQDFGCEGEKLEELIHDFFRNRLPEKGAATIFLLDNFEENLTSAENGPVPTLSEESTLPELNDQTLAGFLSRLICSGKTRIFITSRYPFKLPKNQHRSLTKVPLGALSPAETRKLMSRLEGFSNMDHEDRLQVARTIGGHPRTLEFLDAILQDGRFTYKDVERRLLNHLSEETVDLIKRKVTLSENLRTAVTLAARDCFLDQLLSRLAGDEKRLLFHFSVFQEPRPKVALSWVAEKVKLAGDLDKMLNRLIQLSLVYKGDRVFFVHRWTAEYLRQVMGEEAWKQANLLAGDYLWEPTSISLGDGLDGWRHYLAGGDMERADEVAGSLEDRLDTWGHWDLRKIVCRTMTETTESNPALHANWLHRSGILAQ